MSLEPTDNEIRRVFHLFDTDQSGKVSTSMLPPLIRAFHQNPTALEIQRYKTDVDPQQTGYFDYADFSKSLLKRWRDPVNEEEKLRLAFQQFDKEKSGFIKLHDMVVLLKRIGDGLSLEEVDDFVQLCKTSGFTNGETVDYKEVSRLLVGGAQ